MKTKVMLFFSTVLLSSGLLQAQANQDCARTASLAYSDAKAGNYEAAYPRIQEIREECPSYSIVTYQYGAKILESMLAEAPDAEKEAIAEDLISLYRERLEHFPGKTEPADVYIDVAQTMYDNDLGSPQEQFAAFEKAFTEDVSSFNAKALYTYFTLLVDLQDAGEKTLQDVFDQYDDVMVFIEGEKNKMAEGLEQLIEKQDAGETLTKKEESRMNAYEKNLIAYNTIERGINSKLGQRADCENLIPLYSKDFEEKKTDVEWLENANTRLSSKECTDDPLFKQVSVALHELNPSAESAKSLGQQAQADGNASEALQYFNQAAELETNENEKAGIYMMIANNYRNQGSFGQARTYYNRALNAKPSLGRAYLYIADMIAKSVNNCGTTSFEKRAVYWLAADYASRAGRVDPSLSSNANEAAAAYRGRAPQKADIFQEDMAGKTINIGCWIGESVKVPTL